MMTREITWPWPWQTDEEGGGQREEGGGYGEEGGDPRGLSDSLTFV